MVFIKRFKDLEWFINLQSTIINPNLHPLGSLMELSVLSFFRKEHHNFSSSFSLLSPLFFDMYPWLWFKHLDDQKMDRMGMVHY
jgi:hypothetical protein